MTTNTEITVFHYDDVSDSYAVAYTGAAYMYLKHDAEVGKGLTKADVSKIRIPTAEEITVVNGDRVMVGIIRFGENEEARPAPDAMTITAWADRRCGANPHWWFNIS